LGLDLGGEAGAGAGGEKKPQRCPSLTSVEPSVMPHQGTESSRRQDRRAIDQHQVQPEAQARQSACPHHRVGDGRRADHQAGAGQDAVAVCLLDRLVDRDVATEIVGADDQPPPGHCTKRGRAAQPAISRRRRN
jgi:hypothetical protein